MQENSNNANNSFKLESLNFNNYKKEIELSKVVTFTESQKNEISLEIMEQNNQELYYKYMFLAKICINLENFEDSLRYVDEMAKLKETEFTVEERELFVNAYKGFISHKRNSWRTLYKKEEKLIENKNQNSNIISEIKTIYEDIIFKANGRIIKIIDTYIFHKIKSIEGRTFFLKVKADHYRYMAEISFRPELNSYRNNANKYYQEAYKSSIELNPLNVIRLGVALNYSVFYYEVLSHTFKSLVIATNCLDEAMNELKSYDDEKLNEDHLKEALDIIKLIKDNLHQWAKETASELVLENE